MLPTYYIFMPTRIFSTSGRILLMYFDDCYSLPLFYLANVYWVSHSHRQLYRYSTWRIGCTCTAHTCTYVCATNNQVAILSTVTTIIQTSKVLYDTPHHFMLYCTNYLERQYWMKIESLLCIIVQSTFSQKISWKAYYER